MSISQVHTRKPIDQSVANNAKEKIITKDEISDVKAVKTNKELLVAIKVDNFNRFRLKKLTGASSHDTAVEKQFRYPIEYGGQKPPTAQWLLRVHITQIHLK